jgi:hypothetical protein
MAIRRVLMIGDVVGDPGLAALTTGLGPLRSEYSADLVIVNGENAANGFGLTEANYRTIRKAGADVVTTGNHVWEKRDLWPFLDSETRLLRPINYPSAVGGHGWITVTEQGIPWTVVNAQGREDLYPIDCPFQTLDRLLKDPSLRLRGEVPGGSEGPSGTFIVVDFHAEAPQEKEALAFYLDGRISVLVGTHTHVQTADERILPHGTAYITDLGMTGVTTGIIGMDTAICVNRNKTQIPIRMEGAQGPTAIQGVAITLDDTTGRALAIERIHRSTVNP